MTKKEKEIIKQAFDILKKEINDINRYYQNYSNLKDLSNVKALKKLTKINIPGFGCFYITATGSLFGPNANPNNWDYDGDEKWYRQLRFRSYGWTKTKTFRWPEKATFADYRKPNNA